MMLSAAARVTSCAAANSRPRAISGTHLVARRFGSLRHASPGWTSLQTAALNFSSRPHSRGLRSFQVRADSSGNGAGEQEYDFDLFTLGAGSGGTRASRMSAQKHGAKVAVCELPFGFISNEKTGGAGGTCVLRGCVPKKLMVYAAGFPKEFAESQGFGWNLGGEAQIDWPAFMEKKGTELKRLNKVYMSLLEKAGVTYMEGRGKLIDAHTVDVDGKKYTAKNILIAVGGRAVRAPVDGAEHAITSDEILELQAVPKKLVVIGSGYIGLEFACIFRNLGAEVDVYIRGSGVLRGFDKEVTEFVAKEYERQGIRLHFGTSPTKIAKNDDGSVTITAEKKGDGDSKEQVEKTVDHVLMATGRSPNTEDLGLEEAGVELGKKGVIKVDEFSRSSVPNIYAIGDVTDRMNLTPVALMEGMAFAANVFGGDKDAKPKYDNIASAVFTTPQIATCGYTEEAAAEEFGALKIFFTTFRGMKATISGDEGKGMMKLIVAADSDKLVGAHIVGGDAAEIMQGIAVAMKMGVTKKQLDSTVGIHPSAAEEIVTLRDVTREVSAPQKEQTGDTAESRHQGAGRES